MTKFLNKIPLLIATPCVLVAPIFCMPLTSCSANNTIQFANFESYMDNGLMNHLARSYDVQFQWYTVTEMIETKFQHTYDVAAPSGYELSILKNKNWLEPIDWTRFGIPGVSNGKQALESTTLFAEPIRGAITKMNNQLDASGKFNILDYGIPYFAQSFMFVYKGKQVTFYKAGTNQATNQPNWNDIFYTISPNMISHNPDLAKRKGLLDDPKTMYDICRIMETITENPQDSSKWTNKMTDDISHNRMLQTFSFLTNKARRDWYTLNTDSGLISRSLADHGPHSFGCAFTWSGDALYAAQGAGEFEPYTGDQMHIQKPNGVSLDEIEFLVINNKNHNDSNKLDRIYNVFNDICFKDAWNASEEQLKQRTSDNNRYSLWPMQNFDTVNYTPVLKSIYDYTTKLDSDYWDCPIEDIKTRELYTSILKINATATPLFGRPLSSIQNSETQWAWIESRDKL